MSLDTSRKTKYLKLKYETAKLFNSKCIGCDVKYDSSFAFHHVWYIDGEKIYSDFDSNEEGTIEYNLYVLPIIQRQQERFRLVCNGCHGVIEKAKKYNFSKLNQCYTLSKKILPEFIKQYCDIWVNHQYDLKQYFKIIFAGRGNMMSKKLFDEINNGSLDKWDKQNLYKSLWEDNN